MRLISLNVLNGGGRRIAKQVEVLISYGPDVVALQEVVATTVPLYVQHFSAGGYRYWTDSLTSAENPSVLTGARRYGELIVSRWPLSPLSPNPIEVPWPERILSAAIHPGAGDCELHVAYVPHGSGHGGIKIETLEGIYAALACPSERPRILCGDFNLPQEEHADGTVITWGQHRTTKGWVLDRQGGSWWDQGERNIILGLAEHDLADTFRLLNGYDGDEASWYPLRRSGMAAGRRFDHVFASRSFQPVRCVYLHEFRELVPRLSDHSALLLDGLFADEGRLSPTASRPT